MRVAIHGLIMAGGLGLLASGATWAQTCSGCTGTDLWVSRFTPFCPDRALPGSPPADTEWPHFCFEEAACAVPSGGCPGGWPACPAPDGACLSGLGGTCTVPLCSSIATTPTTTLPPALSRNLDHYGLLAMTHMNTGDSKMGGYTPGGGCHIGVNCALQGTEGPLGVLIMNKAWVPEGTQIAGWKTRFRVRGCPPAHIDQLFSNDVPNPDRCNVCIGDTPALAGLPLKTDKDLLAPKCSCRTAGKAPWPRRSGNAWRRTHVPYDGSAVIRDDMDQVKPDLAPGNVANNTALNTCNNCGTPDPQYFEEYWDVKLAGLTPPVSLTGTPTCTMPTGPISPTCMTDPNGVGLSVACAKQMLDAACGMSDLPADECNIGNGGINKPPAPLDPHNPCRTDPDGPDPTGPLRSCHKVIVDGASGHGESLVPGVYRQVKVQNGTLKLRNPGRYVICDLVVDKNKTLDVDPDSRALTGVDPPWFTLRSDTDPLNDRVTVFVRTSNVGSAASVFWEAPKGGTTPIERCEHVRIAAFEGVTTSTDLLNFSKSAKVQATIYAPKRDVAFGENTTFRGRIVADDIASNFASYSCCKTGEPPVDSQAKNCVAAFECPPGWTCDGGQVPSDDTSPLFPSGVPLLAGNCRKSCQVAADCSDQGNCVGGWCTDT